MTRVLVLGGTGFIGRTLCEQLVQAGGGAARVSVPSRRPARARTLWMLPGVDLLPADVHDEATLVRLLRGRDAVVNLVAILHGSEAAFRQVHVELPARLARACQAAGVRRVVHVSALGVTDADFPPDPKKVIRGGGRYMGQGPYLGQENKYLVLVTEKSATYLDFLKTYIGRTAAFGQRWNFKEAGSLFYGIGSDMEEGRLRHDTALHANLVFNVSHNLIDGFRHYSYDLPVWIKESLGHWFERQISPKWNSFDQNEGGIADMKTIWRWEPYTRQCLGGKFTPLSDMMTWRDYNQIKFDDHVLGWSRMDFIMSMGKEKFSQFIFEVKGRVHPETWLPDTDDLVGATREALQKVYGLSPLTFDVQWKEWVMKNYASQ